MREASFTLLIISDCVCGIILRLTCRHQSSLVLVAYLEAKEQHRNLRLWVSPFADHQQKLHILLPSQRILQMSLILWAAEHPMVPRVPNTFSSGRQSTERVVDELLDQRGTLYLQLLKLGLQANYKNERMFNAFNPRTILRRDALCLPI